MAIVLINPAMGVRIAYYRAFAQHLAKQGYLAFTYNYRGIGVSRPEKMAGFEASVRIWAERDFGGVSTWLAHTYPGLDRYLVTHSVGGQILALSDATPLFKRVLMVASQHGCWRNWSGSGRLRVALLSFGLIPALTSLNGYFPARRLGLFEDLPAGVAREWARWIRSPDYLFSHVTEADARAATLQTRIHSISFSDDDYAPPHSVERLLDKFSGAQLSRSFIAPAELGLKRIGHFGFFRESARDTLWPLALSFLSEGGRA